MVDGMGGNSKRGLKWGGVGWGFIKESFQTHLEMGKGKNCS